MVVVWLWGWVVENSENEWVHHGGVWLGGVGGGVGLGAVVTL